MDDEEVRTKLADWLDGKTSYQEYWEHLIMNDEPSELEARICLMFCEQNNPEPYCTSMEYLRAECIKLLHGTDEFPIRIHFLK